MHIEIDEHLMELDLGSVREWLGKKENYQVNVDLGSFAGILGNLLPR